MNPPPPECRYCGASLVWARLIHPITGRIGRWIPLEDGEAAQSTLEGLEEAESGRVVIDAEGWARIFRTTEEAKAWRAQSGDVELTLYHPHDCPKAPARSS